MNGAIFCYCVFVPRLSGVVEETRDVGSISAAPSGPIRLSSSERGLISRTAAGNRAFSGRRLLKQRYFLQYDYVAEEQIFARAVEIQGQSWGQSLLDFSLKRKCHTFLFKQLPKGGL